MITNDEKWHYLAEKSLPRLLRRITLKNNGAYSFINYLHSPRTESRLKSYESVCQNHDHRHVKKYIRKFYEEHK